MSEEWITVAEYIKRKNIRNRQTVYNWLAMGKLKKGVDWKEETVTKKRKLIRWQG
jgi:hypothetical protein